MHRFKAFFRQHKSLLLFICLLATFRGAIADWHPVPTGSMKPTILEGDVVWHNKLAYDLKFPFTNVKLLETGEPQRGDIVVVNSASADKRLIKRLVGLPGDRISIHNNRLSVNGEIASYETLPDDQLAEIRLIDREPGRYALEVFNGLDARTVHMRNINNGFASMQNIVVPDGHYYLMGDSRDNSADSRYYGAFPRHELRGRATHIIVSMNILDAYKPRLERILNRLQ